MKNECRGNYLDLREENELNTRENQMRNFTTLDHILLP
jgi:hypothetical protein